MIEAYNNLGLNEQRKALILQEKALSLGIDLADCEIGVNPTNGNIFLWSEWYSFSLYIGLYSDTVYVLFITDFETGEEHEEELSNFNTLEEVEDWGVEYAAS